MIEEIVNALSEVRPETIESETTKVASESDNKEVSAIDLLLISNELDCSEIFDLTPLEKLSAAAYLLDGDVTEDSRFLAGQLIVSVVGDKIQSNDYSGG